MNWVITIYVALLFFVLTPGVLVTLPPKSSKLVVAAFHALVFALVWHFTHKLVWSASVSIGAPGKKEGFDENMAGKCPAASVLAKVNVGDSCLDAAGGAMGGGKPCTGTVKGKNYSFTCDASNPAAPVWK